MKTSVWCCLCFLMLLISVSFIEPQFVEAQLPPKTLADTINIVLNGAKEQNSTWNVIYDQIFCRQNTAVYDNTITKALNNHEYKDIILIARLAELNNYTSPTITNSLRVALENMPMTGSLPITYTGKDAPDSFIVYDRYMINAYRYAQALNIPPRWDINIAYNNFVKAYNTPSNGSTSGEMLWINPELNYSRSYTSRYYDEHAETLSMFLLFSLNGIDTAMTYADDAWLNIQDHWNGQIYGYTGKTGGVECEMGNFAQIITQYKNNKGNIPHFDRVITDIENKLLTNQYNSPGWGTPGVIKHADANPQNRLSETMASLIALHMLYPQFTKGNQTNFQNMLTNAWQGLINSNLYNNGKFSFSVPIADYNDEASLLGAMTLFLYGIIPQTGHLDIEANEELYGDYRTCFQTAQWQFNYTNHSIRIPVTKGNLTFIFGTQNITQTFPENGTYDIQFNNNWNNITSIKSINDNTEEPPKPHPTSTTAPTTTPNTTNSPLATPSEEPKQPTATPSDNEKPTQTSLTLFLYVGVIAAAVVLLAGIIYLGKKRVRK